MASKTVQPVAIELGIKGGEKLAALNRSFRDLSKQVKLSDADIAQATKDIVKFATEAGNSEATIKGQIKAFEGLREQAALGGKAYTELTQGISKLQSTLRGSSDAVERERSSLVKLGSASKNSAKDLQYVIGQLEKLKSKVREDSAAFLQLGKDIKNLNVNLKEVEISAGKARFAINTILSAKPEKITGQIEKLSAAIASGTLEAEDLNIALRKLELLRVGAGRGPVAFRADVFSSQLGVDYFARLRKEYGNLEKTQAAISQRISEVNTELQNVSGYERRRSLTLELIRLNKELQQSIVNVTTREQFQAMAIRQRMGGTRESYAASGFGAFSAEIRQRTAGGEFTPGMQRARERAQERARERRELEQVAQLQQEINRLEGEYVDSVRSAVQTIQGLELKRHEEFMSQVAAEDAAQKKAFQEQQSREEREYQRRVAIGRQMRTGEFASRRLIGMPNQELSQLYGGIVRIGQADQMRQLEMMGRGYDEVANDIRKVTAASNGSVSSLNAQRSAWSSLRDILDPASQQFKEVTREIERVDKALEKTQRRRRGMSPMQMTQAAGAAISGGIFGGPEGFLGGAIGAIGGVGGAFAGAAIGAQVGGLRRQLGEFADYAAGIQKLQIALRGVAGSQSEFNKALVAARNATDSLNVPQETAIQGITRLTAAVKGAGGNVGDASLAFRNISSAIIATGGGAEQVEGAITALVQIFSKGKVSMEEINQIAERLPGTFNTFAEAAGMTGPEMLKALQQGKVGLNDLMSFLIEVGNKYNATASSVANSSQSAGAKLQVAFNDMRIAVGESLQPIGAEFQAVFTDFIEDITPAMVAVLPKIGKAALVLAENLDVLAISAGTAFAAMGVAKIAAVGGLGAALLKLAAAAGTASGALQGTAAAALLNPWVALAAGVSAATVGIYKYYEGQKELNALLDDGAGSTQVIKDKILEYEDSIRKATEKLKGINGEQKATGRDAQRLKKEIIELKGELDRLKGTYKIRIEYERKGYKYGEGGAMEEFTVGDIVYGGPAGARARPLRRVDGTPLDGVTDYKGPDGGAADREAESQARKIAAAEAKAVELGEKLRRMLRDVALEFKGVGASAEEAIYIKANKAINAAIDQEANLLKQIDELSKVTGNPYEKLREAAMEYAASLVTVAEKQRDVALQEESNKRFAALLKGYGFSGDVDVSGKMLGVMTPQEFPTGVDSILRPNQLKQNIEELRTSLQELVDPVNQITGAATAIGDAFSQSFVDAISGSKTAKEALADFFSSVGSYFLDMAKQIIAQMIQIAILNAVTGLLPGLGGGGLSGGLGGLSGTSNVPFIGSMPFTGLASGGPVMPGNTYVVGERGPELLTMTPSGGYVTSNSASQAAMDRYSSGNTRGGSISVNYNVTEINGMKFVTEDQFRAGISEAAKQGAEGGFNRTMTSLKNSRSTRSRVGV